MLGAALAGVSGAFYAHYIGYISPDQFVPLVTFQIWMAIIMGGVGRVSGALAGTLILMLFLEGSRFLRDVMPFISEVGMASVRLGLVGLALTCSRSTGRRPDGGGEAAMSLVARKTHKAYGGQRVVDQVSLTIPRDGMTGIIGPGAGKSTLFSLVTGFIDADFRLGAAGRPCAGPLACPCPRAGRHGANLPGPARIQPSLRA